MYVKRMDYTENIDRTGVDNKETLLLATGSLGSYRYVVGVDGINEVTLKRLFGCG
jgi:hypothetical protein